MNDEYDDDFSPPEPPHEYEVKNLIDAIENNDLAAVTAFLDRHPAFADQIYSGETALGKAAANGKKDIVELLLTRGAQADARDQNKRTPLIIAADKGQTKIAALLLEHGAQIDAAEQGGDTALMRAAQQGYTKIVELLLEKGADTSIKNSRGQTALTLGKTWGEGLEIAALIGQWPERQRQRKEKERRQAMQRADDAAQTQAATRLERLKSRGAPPSPFKRKM